MPENPPNTNALLTRVSASTVSLYYLEFQPVISEKALNRKSKTMNKTIGYGLLDTADGDDQVFPGALVADLVCKILNDQSEDTWTLGDHYQHLYTRALNIYDDYFSTRKIDSKLKTSFSKGVTRKDRLKQMHQDFLTICELQEEVAGTIDGFDANTSKLTLPCFEKNSKNRTAIKVGELGSTSIYTQKDRYIGTRVNEDGQPDTKNGRYFLMPNYMTMGKKLYELEKIKSPKELVQYMYNVIDPRYEYKDVEDPMVDMYMMTSLIAEPMRERMSYGTNQMLMDFIYYGITYGSDKKFSVCGTIHRPELMKYVDETGNLSYDYSIYYKEKSKHKASETTSMYVSTLAGKNPMSAFGGGRALSVKPQNRAIRLNNDADRQGFLKQLKYESIMTRWINSASSELFSRLKLNTPLINDADTDGRPWRFLNDAQSNQVKDWFLEDNYYQYFQTDEATAGITIDIRRQQKELAFIISAALLRCLTYGPWPLMIAKD